MLNFFRNKLVALIIAVVAVGTSTLVSVNAKLSSACEAQEAAFFTAREGKAPGRYIDQQISAAAALATVGGHYASLERDVAALRDARTALVRAYEDRDIPDICEAAGKLERQVETFEDVLGRYPLSAEDKSAAEDAFDTVYGARKMIADSSYNADVRAFNSRVYNAFPANVFAELLNIDEPELYAEED